MSRLTETLCQLIVDLEAELAKLNVRNSDQLELIKNLQEELNQLRQSFKQLGDISDEKTNRIKSLRAELEKPQQDLNQYLDQIGMLQNEINTLKNTPQPLPSGPRDNLLKALPGYGEVLASALLQAGWTTKQIDNLETVNLRNLPNHDEWHSQYCGTTTDENEAVAVEPPDVPDVPDADVGSPVWNKRRTCQ